VGAGSVPGWRAAIAVSLVALAGCDLFDESLLARVDLPSGGAGRGSPGAGGSDGGSAGRGGRDASVPPMSGAGGSRPPTAGHVSPPPDGGGMDAAAGHDAGMPDPQDAGLDAAPPDAMAPDAAPPDAGPPVCEPVAPSSYCSELPPLAAAPVLDGVLDCGPALLAITEAGWNGSTALPASHSARMAAAWRPNGIYVYVEVSGTPRPHPSGTDLYCGDAIEFYADHDAVVDSSGNYADPGTRQFVVGAPSEASPGTIEAFEFVEGSNWGPWETTDLKTARRDDGYSVEAFISAGDLDLTAWSPGTRVGLDIAIDVSAPSGTSGLRCGLLRGQYFLRVGGAAGSACGGEPWCDARAFCTPMLLEPSD
jgi:hypothetical protein